MVLIRDIRPEEIPLLEDFLYEAIFVPEGVPAPPRDIVRSESRAGITLQGLQFFSGAGKRW